MGIVPHEALVRINTLIIPRRGLGQCLSPEGTVPRRRGGTQCCVLLSTVTWLLLLCGAEKSFPEKDLSPRWDAGCTGRREPACETWPSGLLHGKRTLSPLRAGIILFNVLFPVDSGACRREDAWWP